MKRSLLFMLIFLFVMCLVSGCGKEGGVREGVELLKNGNMEEGTIDEISGEQPRYWYFNKGDPLSEIKYTIDPTNGSNKCIKMVATAHDGLLMAYQKVTNYIPIGKKVKLTVRIKTENLVGQGASIVIRCDDTVNREGEPEQFATTQSITTIEGTKEWTYYSLELGERIKSTIKSITVFLLVLPDTSGTVYFDNASLIVY